MMCCRDYTIRRVFWLALTRASIYRLPTSSAKAC